MEKFEFIPDISIEKSEDDRLGRIVFAQQLKKSLSNWHEKESLVAALKGKWGEGKTSVLNLVKEQFNLVEDAHKPTIIDFNPWVYSNKNNISNQFYEHIANEIKYESKNDKNRQAAKKLKLYGELLNLTSEQKTINGLISKLPLIFVLFGFSINQILSWINVNIGWISIPIYILSIILLLLSLSSQALIKLSKIYENNTEKSNITAKKLKAEIKSELLDRKKKLLIVIDDLDRLTSNEIFEIFQLIKLNADFPNTIYLLAYDNQVIMDKIQEQKGISGIDYLKKIIQVEFDLPFVNREKIFSYLFDKLNIVVAKLPNEGDRFFGANNTYWSNSFHSGYKDFFENIRDIKRYYNSVLFNIDFLIREGSYEVNPVDFFCLEVIRVFLPEMHTFIKSRKGLFVDIVDYNDPLGTIGKKSQEQRRDEIEQAFNFVLPKYKNSSRSLLINLFPQIKGILDGAGGAGYHYSSDSISNWNKELRICSKNYFDAYFTLIPGGNEGELTQYEIDKTILGSNTLETINSLLIEFIKSEKIGSILERLQDYTEGKTHFDSLEKSKNMIIALFNIADMLSSESKGFAHVAQDMNAMRIIYQLLKSNNQSDNFEILEDAIKLCNGIYGPMFFVAIQAQANLNNDEALISNEDIVKIQDLTVSKIYPEYPELLLSYNHFLYILYRFSEWSNRNKFDQFIEEVKKDDKLLLKFCSSFVNVSYSQTSGQPGKKVYRKINFKGLDQFIGITEIKILINKILKNKIEINQSTKLFIDQFNIDLEEYTKAPDTYLNNIFNFN